MLVFECDYTDIIDMCFEARKYIYMASPGIHEEVVEALLEIKEQDNSIEIICLVDIDENAFRKYHGTIAAIRTLIEAGVEVRQIPNHRLSFIITDIQSILLFQTNRSVETEVNGPNAIFMPSNLKAQLSMKFFGVYLFEEFYISMKAELERLLIDKEQFELTGVVESLSNEIDLNCFEVVEKKIRENPPKHPDLKRRMDVYTTKIRFIELEIKGIHLDRKSISLPKEILKLTSPELKKRIKATIAIFDDDEAKTVLGYLQPINEKINEIRGKYLHSVPSRKKSVILVENIEAFRRELDSVKKDYESIKKDIVKAFAESYAKLEIRIADEIFLIFTNNPPSGQVTFSDPFFIRLKAEEEARKIPKPSVENLLSSFSITWRAFDPTWSDFQDKPFLDELHKIGFISAAERKNIVDDTEAFGVAN